MMNERLYTRCPVCSGDDLECVVCDGIGFIDSGLHTGQVDTMMQKNKELSSSLKFIHDIVYEDLRTANNSSGTWSIEAITAKALELSDTQRDIGINADDKLADLIKYIAERCEKKTSAQ